MLEACTNDKNETYHANNSGSMSKRSALDWQPWAPLSTFLWNVQGCYCLEANIWNIYLEARKDLTLEAKLNIKRLFYLNIV